MRFNSKSVIARTPRSKLDWTQPEQEPHRSLLSWYRSLIALRRARPELTDPRLDRVNICSAGHYPPIIAPPGQPTELTGIPPGLLIGAAPGARRQVATLGIAPGTLVCFYTDGLIERRHRPIEDGLARLCHVVTAEPPDAACVSVMAALVGSEPANDDIALLMFRRQPAGIQP